MSMHLDFEPHSWYFEFAIKKDSQRTKDGSINIWSAFTDDGNTYTIVRLHSATLKGLRAEIIRYWIRVGVPAFYEKKLRRAYEKL